MKKIEYLAPEMEVVEIKSQMLAASTGETPGQGNVTDPGEEFPDGGFGE